MIRNIAIWLFHWYADDARALPNWLRRWIESDAVLLEYSRRFSQLENQLKVQSRSLLAEIPDPHDCERSLRRKPSVSLDSRPSPQREHSQSNVPWLALAASVVCVMAVGIVMTQRLERRNAKPIAMVNQPSESTEASRIDPALVSDPRLAKELTDQRWRDRARVAKNLLERSIKRTENAPSIATQKLDARLGRELTSIRSEFGNASRFFAVKLPLAGYKLIGGARTQ